MLATVEELMKTIPQYDTDTIGERIETIRTEIALIVRRHQITPEELMTAKKEAIDQGLKGDDLDAVFDVHKAIQAILDMPVDVETIQYRLEHDN
jgi:hypothetical protein